MRRRRQRKLDREIDEAAAEAATAPIPTFLDDDDNDRYGSSGYHPSNSGPSGMYSDMASSHGTYGQQPMSPDSYEMTGPAPGTLFNQGPAPGAVFDYSTMGAGAAGIGVQRARSQLNNQSNPFNNPAGEQPHAAFNRPEDGHFNVGTGMAAANVQYNTSPDPYHNVDEATSNPNYHDAPAAYRSNPQHQHQGNTPSTDLNHYAQSGEVYQRGMSPENAAELARVKSQGSRSGLLDPSPGPLSAATTESYASYYQPGGAHKAKEEVPPLPNPYGGIDDGAESDDDDDASSGRKVLKVANE